MSSISNCDACKRKFHAHQTVHLYTAFQADSDLHLEGFRLKTISHICDLCDRTHEYSTRLKSQLLYNDLPTYRYFSANDYSYFSDPETESDDLYCSICEEDLLTEDSMLSIWKKTIVWKKRLLKPNGLKARDSVSTANIIRFCSSCVNTEEAYFDSIRAAAIVSDILNDYRTAENK